jgi:hypothetical protein
MDMLSSQLSMKRSSVAFNRRLTQTHVRKNVVHVGGHFDRPKLCFYVRVSRT